MATSRDLSRRKAPIERTRQRSRNRDTLIPQRRNTSAPDAEINSRILRPDDDAAFELRRLLGLVNDTASSALAYAREKQLQKDAELGARAAADFATGQPDEKALERVDAYRRSYHVEQARAAAFEYERTFATRAEALANQDLIPDLDDFVEAAEQTAQELFLDEEGKFKGTYAETPEAATLLARSMSTVRGRILAEARNAIKKRTDEDFLRTRGTNAIREYIGASTSWREAVKGAPLAPAPDTGTEPEPTDPGLTASSAFAGWRVGGVPGDPRDGGRRLHKGYDIFPPEGSDGKLIADRPFQIERVRNGPRQGITADVVFDDGTRWTLMHLASRPQTGRGEPGDLIAVAGNTGNAKTTPAHFHAEGKDANGNPIDPRPYFGIGEGEKARQIGLPGNLSFPDQARAVPSGTLPKLSFETLMADLPPGMDRGTAKATMLEAITFAAEEAGAWRALDDLMTSNRADGTPSFSPAELSTIADVRDRIREKNRVEGDRVRKERYEGNFETIIDAVISTGALPSQKQIRDWRDDDRISPEQAYSLSQTIESEARQAVSDARSMRAEARDAQREVDFELDVDAESLVAMRQAGILDGASADEDQARLRRGELGSGTRALARYRRLRAAAVAGEAEIMRDPQSVHYAERIRAEFKVSTSTRGTGRLLLRNQSAVIDPVPGMLAEYRKRRLAGEEAHAAYEGAVAWKKRTYGDAKADPLQTARKRVEQLRQQAGN